LITLLTDFGSNSIQTARSKAWLSQHIERHSIVDIAHDINPNDINEAAYVFKLMLDQFEPGCIHLIAIDFDQRETHPEVVYFKFNDQHVITYNSGIASLVMGESESIVIDFGTYQGHHYDAIVESFGAAVKLIDGGKDSDRNELLPDKLNIKTTLNPVTSEHLLHGHVIYFDARETCYTNITRSIFESFTQNGPFDVVLSRHERISKISDTLRLFESGGTYCYFNTAGLLTISVYRGSAKRMYGLKRGQSIMIEKR
jgi:S-adenosylmethionine hydrolase